MEINKELVKHIATVARLDLSEDEINKFVPELKEVLESFSDLDKIDVKDVKPSFQPVEVKNHMREDVIEESLSQDDVLKLSKSSKDGYFKGPKAV